MSLIFSFLAAFWASRPMRPCTVERPRERLKLTSASCPDLASCGHGRRVTWRRESKFCVKPETAVGQPERRDGRIFLRRGCGAFNGTLTRSLDSDTQPHFLLDFSISAFSVKNNCTSRVNESSISFSYIFDIANFRISSTTSAPTASLQLRFFLFVLSNKSQYHVLTQSEDRFRLYQYLCTRAVSIASWALNRLL